MGESIPLVDLNNLPNSVHEFEFSAYERNVENRILQRGRDVANELRRRIPWKFTETHIPIEETTVGHSVVDLSAATSTTALLGTGGAAATGLTGVGASVGTAAGVGIGGVVVGGILGSLLTRDRGATLPGHHFIGPGNPVDEAPPVDKDDEIAKRHDIAYGTAKTVEDVHRADKAAIQEFKKDYEEHGNLHSKVGQVGLTLKHNIEKFTGILYPPLPGTST